MNQITIQNPALRDEYERIERSYEILMEEAKTTNKKTFYQLSRLAKAWRRTLLQRLFSPTDPVVGGRQERHTTPAAPRKTTTAALSHSSAQLHPLGLCADCWTPTTGQKFRCAACEGAQRNRRVQQSRERKKNLSPSPRLPSRAMSVNTRHKAFQEYFSQKYGV